MPVYQFQDSENIPAVVEAGDYVIRVTETKFGLSQAGNAKVDLTLQIEKTGTILYDTLTFTDKAFWRIDTFLKSCGVKLAKGQGVEFDPDVEPGPGEVFIPLVGLRGWATLFVDEYPKDSGRKKNKVLMWITNKEKLARIAPPPRQADPMDAPLTPSEGVQVGVRVEPPPQPQPQPSPAFDDEVPF